MKRFLGFTVALFLGAALVSGGWAQEQNQEKTQTQVKDQNKIQNRIQNQIIHGPNFIDENGDGFNDNAPDLDGDGIPNGQDPDFQGAGKGVRQQRFVDADGDGIADNVGAGNGQKFGRKTNRKGGYGPGDGTGTGVRPQDGTGNGPGAGTAVCDGTGPKGKTNRGGKNR